jgi:hypothetical protein
VVGRPSRLKISRTLTLISVSVGGGTGGYVSPVPKRIRPWVFGTGSAPFQNEFERRDSPSRADIWNGVSPVPK